MRDMRIRLAMLIAVVLNLSICAGWAQQSQPPAGSSAPPPQSTAAQTPTQTVTNAPSTAEETNPPGQSEMPALSSGIILEPGSRGSSTSYFLPSFEWTGFFRDTISQDPSVAGTVTQSVYVGDIVLQHVTRHSQLNLDYAGGAESYGSSYLNNSKAIPPGWSTVQRLSFAGTMKSRRLQLTVGDQGMYLPESPYGYAGFSGLQSFGAGSGGAFLGNSLQFNQLISPSQSILTGTGRRYVNVALTEAQFSPTARSTFTVTGSWGITRFLDPGFLNNRNASLMAGYNFRLTRRDEITVTYLHFDYTFDKPTLGILERGFLLGYGHQFGARLSLSISAGPVQNEVAQPQGGNVKQLFWITNDSVRFRARFADFAGSFARYTSPGSGVLSGAETDLASLSAGRRIIGRLRGSLDVGHVYNQALRPEPNGARKSQYETWQAGVTLSHEYGKHTSLYARYQFQYQIASNPACLLGGCRIYDEHHILGAGINWHGQPIRMR